MVGRSEALYTLRRMSENLDMKWTDDTKQLLLFCLFCPLVAHGCDFSGLSQVRSEDCGGIAKFNDKVDYNFNGTGMGQNEQLNAKRRRRRRNVIITQQHGLRVGLWGTRTA